MAERLQAPIIVPLLIRRRTTPPAAQAHLLPPPRHLRCHPSYDLPGVSRTTPADFVRHPS